jgi:hypothetical protein
MAPVQRERRAGHSAVGGRSLCGLGDVTLAIARFTRLAEASTPHRREKLRRWQHKVGLC